MEKSKSAAMTIESMPSMSQASSSSYAASSNYAATTYPLRVLKKSEYKEAALSLAKAFEHDDVVMYPIKTGDRKNSNADKDWKLHLHLMECIVYAHCIKGLATVVGPNYDSVALWYVTASTLSNTKLNSRLQGCTPAVTWTPSARCCGAA